jgi:hypothetical protein
MMAKHGRCPLGEDGSSIRASTGFTPPEMHVNVIAGKARWESQQHPKKKLDLGTKWGNQQEKMLATHQLMVTHWNFCSHAADDDRSTDIPFGGTTTSWATCMSSLAALVPIVAIPARHIQVHQVCVNLSSSHWKKNWFICDYRSRTMAARLCIASYAYLLTWQAIADPGPAASLY